MSNAMPIKIGVVSGKGGVGKTTISASLACILKDLNYSLIAIDTDVDAPNLKILFQTEKKILHEFQVQTTEKAKIDLNLCFRCEKCVSESYCHFNAIKWDDENNIPVIDFMSCEGCGGCSILCPTNAFSIYPINSGNIEHISSLYGFEVVTGETILGSQTSGKLVTELKNYAFKIADKEKLDIALIDGPPGIGCPVIAAITDLNYIVVVIEPTTAALHDASRIIEVINNFKIPFGIVINKADMYLPGIMKLRQYFSEHLIQILGEIPLDKEWPNSIVKGLPISKYSPNGVSNQQLIKITTKILENIHFQK